MAVQWDSENGFSGIAVDIFDTIKNKISGVKEELPHVTEETQDLLKLLEDPDILRYDLKDFFEGIDGADEEFMNFIDDIDLSGDVFEQYQVHLQETANSTTAFQRITTVAGNAIKTLFAALASMAVTFLVSELISGIYQFAQASKDIANSAQEIGSKFKDTEKDISSYKKKVEELQGTINNSSSSIDDVTKAREELMKIIGKKYGISDNSLSNIPYFILYYLFSLLHHNINTYNI